MESGEVLDLGETRQVAARTARVIRFETPASGERGAVGAHKSTKKLFCSSHRKSRPATPYANYKIDHAMMLETVMTQGIVADVAIKTAHFSLVAAAFIFVSMLLLAGVHP